MKSAVFFGVLITLCITTCLGKTNLSIPIETLHDTPHFIVNLDLEPEQRWTHIVTIPFYKNMMLKTLDDLWAYVPESIVASLQSIVSIIGADLDKYLGVYGQEIKGISEATGIDLGDLVVMNLFYEISTLCTSIVAQTYPEPQYNNATNILHARNLDFGGGTDFTADLRNLTVQLEFQKGGQVAYHGTTYVGYVGVLTGMSPFKFSVSVDERFGADPLANIVEIIKNPDSKVISFLIRDLLESADYDEAVDSFTNHHLISPVYLIVGGTEEGQGVVITRDRESAFDVWTLDESVGRWYEVETNYDHQNPDPWWDNRREPAENGMNEIGQADVSLNGMLAVLSQVPVLNAQTTYTTLMSARDNTYETYIRTCDGCPV